MVTKKLGFIYLKSMCRPENSGVLDLSLDGLYVGLINGGNISRIELSKQFQMRTSVCPLERRSSSMNITLYSSQHEEYNNIKYHF